MGRVPRSILRFSTVLGVAAVAAWGAAAGGHGRASAAVPRSGTYLVTEYFPVPETWFKGALVPAKGLPGRHAQDFLWSPTGLSMEFDGVLRDGTRVHFANDEGIDWVNRNGYATRPRPNGGWSTGRGVLREPSPLEFALGPSEPFLRYWHTAAVDPSVIPIGSRIYVPHFRSAPNHGWFVAQDVGHTIIDHQIDLYVPPPRNPDPDLEFAGRLRVEVYPPRAGG